MIKLIGRKVGFLAAIAGAAVIGGATTALVSAAIPSSNDGQIHGCYRNNASLLDPKGALRVIDSDSSQACSTQETALKWGNSEKFSDMQNADLTDVDYRYFNLKGKDLSGADLTNANLTG